MRTFWDRHFGTICVTICTLAAIGALLLMGLEGVYAK